MGCDRAQGYHFAPAPAPASEITEFALAHTPAPAARTLRLTAPRA